MLYDHPQYYEVAFSFRDIPREASLLDTCIRSFSKIPVQSVFEIACGPAPHAGELARLGYHYTGLDNNSIMLTYARNKWQGLQPEPAFVDGDMRNFETSAKADFAFVMLGSLYLNNLEEMTNHFSCMARLIRPGGLYFLDWCIQFTDPLAREMSNVVVSENGGIVIESDFHTKLIDSAKQLYEEIWTIDVDDHGEQHRFQMTEHNRAIYPQEFLLFLESRTEFEFVNWWSDWDFEKPIGGAGEVTRPVALIRRK